LWHLDVRMDGDFDHCHLQYSNICISRNRTKIHPVLYVFGLKLKLKDSCGSNFSAPTFCRSGRGKMFYEAECGGEP
jgi:hypothetical protein